MVKGKTKAIDDLLESESIQMITDRSKPVNALVNEIRTEWAYDLYARRPSPAYMANGQIKPTSLDLVSFMAALADRNAVINIPNYERRRAKNVKEGEWVVSAENRHGKLTGLSANKETFSFSARILDQNVVKTEQDEVGAHRNFLLTDLNGSLYRGWNVIQIHPTAEENRFIRQTGIVIGNKIYFQNFVAPQLWSSFFGAPYIKLKALETRLEDEAQHYRSAVNNMNARFERRPAKHTTWQGNGFAKVDSVPIEVTAFKAEMDLPLRGTYRTIPRTNEAYVATKAWANELAYGILPRLRFSSRAVELAFHEHGNTKASPGWSIPRMQHYTAPGKRTEWNRMNLGGGYALRFREYQKTERVEPRSVF